MNRIYQGRVSKVEISDDKENPWQPLGYRLSNIGHSAKPLALGYRSLRIGYSPEAQPQARRQTR